MGIFSTLFRHNKTIPVTKKSSVKAWVTIQGFKKYVLGLELNRYLIGTPDERNSREMAVHPGEIKMVGNKIVIGKTAFNKAVRTRHCSLSWNNKTGLYKLFVFPVPPVELKKSKTKPTVLVSKNKLGKGAFQIFKEQEHDIINGEYILIPEAADYPVQVRIRYP